MGQNQSNVAAEEEQTNHPPEPLAKDSPSPSESPSASPTSLEDLIAEATAFGDNNESESLDVKAEKALQCPCVAELRKGPCGTQFSEAFVCFIKSTAEEKGSDCVHPFIALQNCIKANPNAFSEDVLEEDSKDVEVEEHRIIPPKWAKESKSNI
ncbi:mitochondrial intermembrane space import and assembly protein 40 homolog [Dioscorea cayenensis subsp. rotundata]|uniref:Mitochondrial intermembrane space import and assembly protein 40 homolog n=1 Tax=Dioscorea cayennensis subsp. rotundata TaxID=55577 RepID=A0AB40CEZ8_DIOCR|nr:mitochondrial intermembrane space import and assembly protein 40 homolog [Dioscorea cayenensis subsp. rotundata]